MQTAALFTLVIDTRWVVGPVTVAVAPLLTPYSSTTVAGAWVVIVGATMLVVPTPELVVVAQ
jgi:hypothetical protein